MSAPGTSQEWRPPQPRHSRRRRSSCFVPKSPTMQMSGLMSDAVKIDCAYVHAARIHSPVACICSAMSPAVACSAIAKGDCRNVRSFASSAASRVSNRVGMGAFYENTRLRRSPHFQLYCTSHAPTSQRPGAGPRAAEVTRGSAVSVHAAGGTRKLHPLLL